MTENQMIHISQCTLRVDGPMVVEAFDDDGNPWVGWAVPESSFGSGWPMIFCQIQKDAWWDALQEEVCIRTLSEKFRTSDFMVTNLEAGWRNEIDIEALAQRPSSDLAPESDDTTHMSVTQSLEPLNLEIAERHLVGHGLSVFGNEVVGGYA